MSLLNKDISIQPTMEATLELYGFSYRKGVVDRWRRQAPGWTVTIMPIYNPVGPEPKYYEVNIAKWEDWRYVLAHNSCCKPESVIPYLTKHLGNEFAK